MTVTDQLKQIVQYINAAPFSAAFNLITFDALEPLQLLQVLSDVLTTIEDKPSIDVRAEAADETAIRLLSALRILKFPPPEDADELADFRRGLVEGDKHIVYPVLLWIFPRVPELQRRLYLARYLVRVDVPTEFMQDAEIEDMFQRCEILMEEFKIAHKTHEAIKVEGTTTEDIRNDIKSMEQEREQVTKQIEKVKKKVGSGGQVDKMIEMARRLRTEADRDYQLNHQKQEQRNMHVHAEQKCQRMEQQIKEVRDSAATLDPKELIAKLTDQNTTQQYLASEKLPKEIATRRKTVQELTRVVSQPALDRKDIEEIKKKIEAVEAEHAALVEQQSKLRDPADDKLGIYRQQASIVSRKKETTATELQEARQKATEGEARLADRKSEMRDAQGNEIITQTQFKNYVNKLRTKSTTYKKKRQDVQDLRAEVGVLQRTEEILTAQANALGANLDMELDIGLLQREKPIVKLNLEGRSESEINEMVENLRQVYSQRKEQIRPLKLELDAVRQQASEYSSEFGSRKKQYESMVQRVENTFAGLSSEVDTLRNDVLSTAAQLGELSAERDILQGRLSVVEDGGELTAEKLKELLQAKIQGADDTAKQLREEQKQVNSAAAQGGAQASAKQIKQWRDLLRIMECKKRCLEQQEGVTSLSQLLQNREGSAGRPPSSQQAAEQRQSSAENNDRPSSRRTKKPEAMVIEM